MASRIEEADVAVRADDLSISRAGRGAPDERVVDGLSFTLPYAHALTIMGPTGAGKSSLLAVIAGAGESGLAVVGGDARVHGIRVRRPGRALRRLTYLTGYLPQSAGAKLPSRFTVSELIGQPITSRDKNVNARALAVRVAGLLDEMQLPLGAAAKSRVRCSPASMARVASNRTTWPWPFRLAISMGVSPRQVASAGAPALNKAATDDVLPRAAATWRGAAPF